MPALISPIEECEVPPTSAAAEYAEPETPVLETVIESPGYAVPGDLTFSWVPGYMPVPGATTGSEEGQMLSTGYPPPKTFPASAASPVVTSKSMDQFLPTMPSPQEDMVLSVETESVRETDKAEVFVIDTAEGSPSTVRCQGDRDSGPDLTREGPFDVYEVPPEPGQSPLVLNSMPGRQFRMTSYDDRDSRTDLDMGRDRAVAAALRLHHDASLIITNVQVMAQFVTSLNRTASEVMRMVYDKEPFPTDAVQFVTPGRRVRRAAHYMAAMGLWRPISGPVFPGPIPVSSCYSCMSYEDCFPDVSQ